MKLLRSYLRSTHKFFGGAQYLMPMRIDNNVADITFSDSETVIVLLAREDATGTISI